MGRRRDHKGKRETRTTDGFDNFAARLGLGQDNLLAKGRYSGRSSLTRDRVSLESMYRTSWIVGRMVDVVAEDMVRGGIDIRAELPPGKVDEMIRAMRRMGVNSRLSEAIKWGRLYGGALAVILIDGADMTTPLDVSQLGQGDFRGLYVLSRHQVTPSTQRIDELGPMLGYPEHYRVEASTGVEAMRIHHSRVIRFVGVELPYDEREAEQGWGASVVERAFDRILALDSATYGSANMMLKSHLRVVGVNKLREILAAGGAAETALTKMFAMIARMQSNEGITLLDKEDIFATHNWTFAGVYDALQAFCEQIAGATGIPLVRLLGQSPKGFASGDADMATYYDTIATQQDDDLRPAIEKLLPVLSRHLWGKPWPDHAYFEFRSLWQPSETDKATIATADAQGVAGLYAAGLLSESQALAELRDAGRVTGRYSGITDEDIAKADQAMLPPAAGPRPEADPGAAAGPDAAAGEAGPDQTIQEVSLNGAQVASMVSIVTSVGHGQLPRESGIEMLMAAFPISSAQAEQIMGEMGRGFRPADPDEPDMAGPDQAAEAGQ